MEKVKQWEFPTPNLLAGFIYTAPVSMTLLTIASTKTTILVAW